jgi:hypothetical protein
MNEELSTGTKTLMYVVALIIDGFQGIINWVLPAGIGVFIGLFLNPVISLAALVVFWMWFKAHGVNIFSGKPAKGTFITIAVESLPVLNSFAPGWLGFMHNTLKAVKRSEGTV